MNNEEKYIARRFFQVEVLKRDGQAYEDFFVKIMQHHNPNFLPVKAHGQFGDRKNDGFDKTTGTYYQVYAPEDLVKRKNNAVKKFREDFKGLYEYWHDSISPVRRFYYVLNNKYRPVPQILYPVAMEIEKEYPGVKIALLLNQALEEIFISLPDDKIYDIIGFIPDPQNIQLLDFEAMNEVIGYLLASESPYAKEDLPEPDFERKIVFNKLSKRPANLLRTGNYQVSDLEEYFVRQSELKEILRKKFNHLYKKGLDAVPGKLTRSDTVFFYILENACPKKTKPLQDAVLVLMAYYFEYCDIYEPLPKEPTQKILIEL